MNPLVTVILPTFNRQRFLEAAIDSVCAQTCPDWELIIADDGSADETRSYLLSLSMPQVRVLLLQHSGNPAKVRNAAVQVARGRYLAFLDSDDVWAPAKLEKQITALVDRPNCRWSYTACDRITQDGTPLANERLRTLAPRDGWIFEPLLTISIAIAMPTVLVERQLFMEIGGFDELQCFGEGQELCLRLALRSEVVAVHEPLCSVRAHDEHYSRNRVAAHASWLRLYEKIGGLIDDSQLRSRCMRMHAEQSLTLARALASHGDVRGLWTALRASIAWDWGYPKWWYGASKAIVRAAGVALVPPLQGRSRDVRE